MLKKEIESGDGEKSQTHGTQTLLRGLMLLECVADGNRDAKAISTRLGTPRSTTHRMLNSLVSEGYLHHVPYQGYTLGFRLIYLGVKAQEQRPLGALARPYLEELAALTGDTVHLGTMEKNQVFYLEKIPGTRGPEMRSRVGQQMPLASTGLGKSLMLGLSPDVWNDLYTEAFSEKRQSEMTPILAPWPEYREALLNYAKQGWVYDLEENELGIRCVAAPIRDISGEIVAAISVASALPYLPMERMTELGPVVLDCARSISRRLGWKG
jgi:DNA-binding IclR family transcriptional regulator